LEGASKVCQKENKGAALQIMKDICKGHFWLDVVNQGKIIAPLATYFLTTKTIFVN